ncbi:penicillin-binding protein 2 [bacterium]|nr:penicillin-binding protein 2 [bacterium]
MKNWRINIVLGFIFLFGAAIISRLVYLQIFQGDLFKALAKGQQEMLGPVSGPRGEIFLKDKDSLTLLATNKTWKFCYLSPKKIKNTKKTVEELSQALNLDKNFISKKINNKESLFEVIKHKLSPEEVQKLKELNLPGVYLGREVLREYPQKTLAAHVIGFVDREGRGQYGVEGYYNDFLKGEEKHVFFKKFSSLPAKGADLVLTVDYNIQYQAEHLLKKAHENLDIEGGEIIVMEPKTGKILALAVFPSFDPNQYQKYAKENNFAIFQNGAIQKLFEPGSIFKPITIAAALDQGKITPHTTYEDKGFVKVGHNIIYNYGKRVWGKRSVTEVLEKSINTGAVFVQSKISRSSFLDYIEHFGFFEKTGVDLEGEIFSQNKELKRAREINLATSAFGQGIEMTPINIARAFCVIANGGKLVKPYIVEKIKKSDNNIIEVYPQVLSENVISSQTASQLTAMLVSVVENGFGKRAKIPGYYIAGKTGTAQIPFSALGINKKGYSEKTWQSFIGFAPAFNPQFLILVKLDNPKTKTAEYSAVPIFQKLAKYIIDYWQIPPDYQ